MSTKDVTRKLEWRAAASIGKGARGYLEAHHRYAIVGLVPKRGGGYLKTRHVVGRARDAHEALMNLLFQRSGQSGSYGQGRWEFVVLDLGAGAGKLHPIVSEAELRERQARGQ